MSGSNLPPLPNNRFNPNLRTETGAIMSVVNSENSPIDPHAAAATTGSALASTPLVSGALAGVAAFLAAALPTIATFVPLVGGVSIAPFLLVLGYIAAFLAGLPLRAPTWAAGKPLVSQAVVPVAGSLAGALGLVGESLGGIPGLVVTVLSYLLAAVAGIALPVPKR